MSIFKNFLTKKDKQEITQGQQQKVSVTPAQPEPSAKVQTPTTPTTPETATPQSTTGTAGKWAKMLGKTPEEKQKEEEARQRSSQKLQAWGHFFDGLRYLGALAGGGKHVVPMQFSSTGAQIGQQEAEKQQRQDKLDADRQAYNMNLYNLQEQERKETEAKALQEEARARQKQLDDWREEEHKAKMKDQDIQTQIHQGILNNQGQKFADAHKTAEHNANRPYDKTGSGGGSQKSAEAEERRVAAAWDKSYKSESKAFWRSHERTQANIRKFNKMMKQKHGVGSSTSSGTSSNNSKQEYK